MADTSTSTSTPRPAPSTVTVSDGTVTAEHLTSLSTLIANLEAEKSKAVQRDDLFMHRIFTAILAFVGKIKVKAEARALREARAKDRKYIRDSSREARLAKREPAGTITATARNIASS